jgi:hypothetical protein
MTKQEWPPHLYRGPNSTAHPYPLEIAFRAQIFIVGAIFHDAFLDAAVGQYLHQEGNPYLRIRSLFLEQGLSEQSWEDNWKAFEAYMRAFPNPVFQNALFSMVMHWDWYIAKLGKFVEFSLSHVGGNNLSKKQAGDLQRIGFKNISDQLSILSESTSLGFELDSSQVSNIVEMDLVRNLGMHNQWSVDDYYRQKAMSPDWKVGTLREVNIKDLEIWQEALTSTILITSNIVAKKYVNVPDFDCS